MSASVFKENHSDNGRVNHRFTVPVGQTYRVLSVSFKFDIAPTSLEDLTITLDANAGPQYDLLLYTTDPGADGATDILWQPDEELFLEGSDSLFVQYDGTDGRTIGIQVTWKAVA